MAETKKNGWVNGTSYDEATHLYQIPDGCSIKMWFKDDNQWPRAVQLSGGICGDWVEIWADGTSELIGRR